MHQYLKSLADATALVLQLFSTEMIPTMKLLNKTGLISKAQLMMVLQKNVPHKTVHPSSKL